MAGAAFDGLVWNARSIPRDVFEMSGRKAGAIFFEFGAIL